uniref:peptidoglycan-binding domain-containing protein n=1 Tax=Falsiroseomonas oryzae TaxID=2766473 RepID=UPI0022EA663B
ALGGPVGALAGAGIGAAAGAATGAATDPSDVNLGRPLWSDPEVRVPGVETGSNARSGGRSGGGAVASSETRELQRALSQRGFDPGPADGVYGARTRQAVMDYQRQNNMNATGRPDRQMLSDLGVSAGSARATGTTGARATSERDRAYMGGGAVVGQGGSTGTGADTRGQAGSTGMTGSGSGNASNADPMVRGTAPGTTGAPMGTGSNTGTQRGAGGGTFNAPQVGGSGAPGNMGSGSM